MLNVILYVLIAVFGIIVLALISLREYEREDIEDIR